MHIRAVLLLDSEVDCRAHWVRSLLVSRRDWVKGAVKGKAIIRGETSRIRMKGKTSGGETTIV